MNIAEEADQALEIIKKGIASANSKAKLQIQDMRLYTQGFVEPGYESYSETSKIVVIGNFQPIQRYDSNLGRSVTVDNTPYDVGIQLFKMGVHLMLPEEWDGCIECCRVLKRLNKNCWDSPSGLICQECVKANPVDYVKSFVGTGAAITLDIDYSVLNYWRVGGDYKLYWSSGAMKDAMLSNGIKDFVFSAQKDVNRIWVSQKDLENFTGIPTVNSLSYELVAAKNSMTSKLSEICPKDFDAVEPI